MRNRITTILLIGFTFQSFAADMVGNDLITYFSSTCKSQGEYTRKAISDAQSLISVLENIKNDEDCKTISGGISELSNLESKLTQLDSQSSLNIEIEKLTAQENELMAQFSQSSDSVIQGEITSAIRQIQINKASFVAELSSKDRYQGENVKDTYSKIVNSANSLFNTVSSNHRCLNKNPNILPAITSLTGAIASSAMLVNPALGLGISAATDFIGHTVEALRKGKYNRMIRKIADSGAAATGYKCVLESLSDRWCSMEDANSFLNLKASINRQTNQESGLLSAVRLNDRDIPVLLDWLNKVRTGVPASTTADAERQEEVFNREAKVRSADALGNGVISQNRPLFDSVSGSDDKYLVLKSVIGALTNNNCSGASYSTGEGSNPLADIYDQSTAPYYLLGLSTPPRDNGNLISFCQFDPKIQWPGGSGTFIPDLNAVQTRYNEWINKARERVNQELTLVLQPDALQVLTTAYEQTGNKWKHSTVDSIDNLKDFLEKFKPSDFSTPSFMKIYTNTTTKLGSIKKIIEGAVIGDEYKDPKKALEEIFETAELQYGVIVFQARLEMIVRVSIKKYLDSLENTDSNTTAQLLAAESFLDVLQNINGRKNLTLIRADIAKAQPVALGNMDAFVEVFGKNINRFLKKNYKKIINSNDLGLNEVYQRDSSEICLLLSSMPSWSKKIDKKYCLNSKLDPLIPGGPESSTLSFKYLNKDFKTRNCGYRDYMRKSKIYQDWGLSL